MEKIYLFLVSVFNSNVLNIILGISISTIVSVFTSQPIKNNYVSILCLAITIISIVIALSFQERIYEQFLTYLENYDNNPRKKNLRMARLFKDSYKWQYILIIIIIIISFFFGISSIIGKL